MSPRMIKESAAQMRVYLEGIVMLRQQCICSLRGRYLVLVVVLLVAPKIVLIFILNDIHSFYC